MISIPFIEIHRCSYTKLVTIITGRTVICKIMVIPKLQMEMGIWFMVIPWLSRRFKGKVVQLLLDPIKTIFSTNLDFVHCLSLYSCVFLYTVAVILWHLLHYGKSLDIIYGYHIWITLRKKGNICSFVVFTLSRKNVWTNGAEFWHGVS